MRSIISHRILTPLALWLLFFLLPSFSNAAEKLRPECENQAYPLPPPTSCSHLITQIHRFALSNPYLYHWSRKPSQEAYSGLLPRTFIDDNPQPAGYSYICTITVDVVPGQEDGEDSFGFMDIAKAANEIVDECLARERGMRPQVGWMGVGLFEEPHVVRVQIGSARRVARGVWWDVARRVRLVEFGGGEVGEVREVGVT